MRRPNPARGRPEDVDSRLIAPRSFRFEHSMLHRKRGSYEVIGRVRAQSGEQRKASPSYSTRMLSASATTAVGHGSDPPAGRIHPVIGVVPVPASPSQNGLLQEEDFWVPDAVGTRQRVRLFAFLRGRSSRSPVKLYDDAGRCITVRPAGPSPNYLWFSPSARLAEQPRNKCICAASAGWSFWYNWTMKIGCAGPG